MSKYIYVVTRIVEGETLGTPIPNLGVHGNYKKAKNHFNAVMSNRIEMNYKIKAEHTYDANLEKHDRYKVVDRALVEYGEEKEELRLEKWIL